ncbi:MAG: hypothetical protein ABJQ85_17040 [Rhizobiaceae bacterium]
MTKENWGEEMRKIFLVIIMICLHVLPANSFEIIDMGERQCSSRMSSSFLSASGKWKKFHNKALFKNGIQIEQRIARNSKNPHVVLIKSDGNSSKVLLNRKKYVEECRTFIQWLFLRNPIRPEMKNESVSKSNYYDFYENNSLTNRDGLLMRSFNFNFRDAKRECVNTAKFVKRHSFSAEDRRLARGFLSRAGGSGSALASRLSRENYASALIPRTSKDRRGLCAFVKLRSTQAGREFVRISIRELTRN